MSAKIIVFEGSDGVGKATQSHLLLTNLRMQRLRVVRREPTKEFSPGKKLIYSMLESGWAKRTPTLFQFVQFFNRLCFQFFMLPQLLKNNDVVILDRWALSGWVYGRCEGVNRFLNEWMYNRAKKADLTIVLSGTSHKRARADDSYEKDDRLQADVRDLYRLMAQGLDRHVLVDSGGTVLGVANRIENVLKENKVLSSAQGKHV